MRFRFSLVVFILLLLWMIPALAAGAGEFEDGVPRMSVEELAEKLEDASVVILDVRTGSSWDNVTEQIPGALRYEPRKAGMWSRALDPAKTYVLYCT